MLPKTALITGASRGLGRAFALELARRGYGLALVARGRPELLETAEEARKSGVPVVAIAADAGRKDRIHPIALQAMDALGSVGLLINNASRLGPVPLRPLQDTDCESLEAVLQLNLLGPFRLSKALLPQMRLRRSGVILNISSDAAVEAYPNWGAYGSSKAAAAHLTRIWSAELEGSGVRLHAIDPGEMDTRMHRDALPDADPSTLARPEDVARRILARLELP